MRRALLLVFILLSQGIARAAVTLIDLSKAANMGPSQSFDGAAPGGEDLREKEGFANIPQGPQTFRGIPFHLLEEGLNGGKTFVVLKGKRKPAFPEAVALSTGHLRAAALYFLNSCRWGGTDPRTAVAEYDVVYDDGQVAVVPLHVGVEITNFSGADDASASFLAWWHPYKNTDMGLSLFPWKNPRPESTIQSILFKSLNKMPVPLLFAVTASDKELVISPVSPKPEKTFVTDTKGWIPFDPAGDSPVEAGGAIDMSGWLDAPAGKHGKVRALGDRLVFEDGTPALFWGTHLKNGPNTPDPRNLEKWANRLASMGCNLVELDPPSAQDPSSAANLEGLVERLKAKGIYTLWKGDPKDIPPTLSDDPSILPASLLSWTSAAWNPVEASGTDPVTFLDTPMVLSIGQSLPAQGILARQWGKPFGFQWTAGWPGEYLAEIPLLVSSYSAFEGWSGVSGMSLSSPRWDPLAQTDDRLEDKPILVAQWPVAALAFLRGDLKEGRMLVLDKEGNTLAALAHRSGKGAAVEKYKTDPAGVLKSKIVEKTMSLISDTQQIRWQGNVGLVQVSSPRFQALVGFLGNKKNASPVWQVESPNLFASLSLISLTSVNLWASNHMLLTGATRMENTGQTYNAARNKLISTGQRPLLLEPLQAKITLFRFKKDPKIHVRGLDADGSVLNEKVPVNWVKNNLIISWIPKAFYLEIYK